MNNSLEQVYSVTEITRYIKSSLEKDAGLNNVWVSGEVYNLTNHSSGHIYFSLKDEGAVLSVVFFKYANRNLKFRLENGMKVLVFGSITVFEKGGRYQININQIRLEGIGELQKRIDQLKEKLEKEGLFDPSRKRPLPFLPRRIGIVTSPTGAAVRDILKVSLRRYPNIEIVLAPAKVQGDDAAETIAGAIRELNRPCHAVDVIIAGRGGGSFEDLMPFNEEIVIRAFAESRVPIVSAVGHQIDHPLSDEAADRSAPTPSAAAEMAVPEKRELYNEMQYYITRLESSLLSNMKHLNLRLKSVVDRRIFTDPFTITIDREMQLADLEKKMSYMIKNMVSETRKLYYETPDISKIMESIFREKKHQFNLAERSVEQLSPDAVLRRGYAIVRDEKKKIIRTVRDVKCGGSLQINFYDGSIQCVVSSISEEVQHEKGEG